jgi:hypothetical protein
MDDYKLLESYNHTTNISQFMTKMKCTKLHSHGLTDPCRLCSVSLFEHDKYYIIFRDHEDNYPLPANKQDLLNLIFIPIKKSKFDIYNYIELGEITNLVALVTLFESLYIGKGSIELNKYIDTVYSKILQQIYKQNEEFADLETLYVERASLENDPNKAKRKKNNKTRQGTGCDLDRDGCKYTDPLDFGL